MPGGVDAVGGGVWEKDDRREALVPGEAEGSDPVQGVWGGDVAWVAGGKYSDAAWGGSGGEMDLGSHGPWKGTADILDGLTGRRGTAKLSS